MNTVVWNKTSVRFPAPFKRVLLTVYKPGFSNCIAIGNYHDGRWTVTGVPEPDGWNVIAWTDLPAAWQEYDSNQFKRKQENIHETEYKIYYAMYVGDKDVGIKPKRIFGVGFYSSTEKYYVKCFNKLFAYSTKKAVLHDWKFFTETEI